MIARFSGATRKSPLLFKLILGGNNRRCHPRRNSYDWLSRDPARTDAFAADARNCDNFTAQAYNDMLSGMLTNYDPRRTAAIDTSVPLLILSGDADPIGEYGKGVIRLRDDFLDLGCDDVRVILYPGARHELLNETNRDQVIRDILDWLNALLESTH